jgi:hypothetical protein
MFIYQVEMQDGVLENAIVKVKAPAPIRIPATMIAPLVGEQPALPRQTRSKAKSSKSVLNR